VNERRNEVRRGADISRDCLMTHVYCDICREYEAQVPATMAFYVQRQDDATAPPPSVRCCDWHEGPAAVAAALLRSTLAPAAVFRVPLSCGTGQEPSL
jgi:hypothetical protein